LLNLLTQIGGVEEFPLLWWYK